MFQRIDDPVSISNEEIDKFVSEKILPIIQFSERCYSSEILSMVDSLCLQYGDKLEVRFYSHWKKPFDAKVLKNIPNVRNLSLDCLDTITNPDKIGELEKLQALSFGVHYFDDKEFLTKIRLEPLKRLSIGGTKKKNINLSHLSRCLKLEYLGIVGHTKNFEVLSSLPKLRELFLSSIGKKQNLNVLNEIKLLESLTLFLGGRESIKEVTNPSLAELIIIRVRGLSDLGDLSRFPRLKCLQVEDQIQIKKILFSKPQEELVDMKLLNCKGLVSIAGLKLLSKLNHLRISSTQVDIDNLIGLTLPQNLDIFAFYTGKSKRDKEIIELLSGEGYREYD
jgi:protein phosphatase 1 regulatory subunit 7